MLPAVIVSYSERTTGHPGDLLIGRCLRPAREWEDLPVTKKKMSTITRTLQHEEGDNINIYITPSSYREDKRSMALIINHITSSSFTLLFLLMLRWLTNTSAYHYTLDGCPTWCGNVRIPFPFGIGVNCSLNEWYSIECKNSSRSSDYYPEGTPFLTSIDLEVLDILLGDSCVRVNHPVTSPNCSVINTGSSSVNLTNSPFQFSSYYNLFVAVGVGCDNQEVMMLTDLLDNKKKMPITQCTVTCNSSTNNINISSCTSPFSVQSLQGYKVNLASIGNNSNQSGGGGVGVVQTSCTYGFLVQDPAISIAYGYLVHLVQNDAIIISITNILDELTTGVQNKTTTHVPVILDWIFPANSAPVVPTPTSDKYRSCFNSSNPFSSSNGRCTTGESTTVTTCYCKFSSWGNPYLPDGCKGVCAGIAGGLFLLIASWWLYKVMKKRNDKKRKEIFFKRNGGFLLQHKLSSSDGNEKIKLFNSNELEKVTDHYHEDRILGQGGQGTVYKGMLSDGRIIAVKKSKVVDEGQVEQFINEVVILSQIIHRNIVKLLGCCLETDVPLLIYEFIPNGTLSQHIHDPNEEFPLSWEMRFRIATEVAEALSYLHYAASIPIYHRDMKSTNILLDDKYKAKVSDFGTSTSIDVDNTHLTTRVQGTFGYLDPEYFQSSQFTDKSDAYSFGVVIVELLIGQKPISSTRSQESRSLVTHFMESMEENCLLEILDPRILKEGRREEMIAVAHIAKRCLNLNGKKRPTMKDVAVKLEGIRMSQGSLTIHQRYEEVEYNTTDLTEAWDVASTSTGTFLDSRNGTALSFDVQPLLHTM
ncbi:unnamed protein product [Camellia sinensis]